MGLFSIVFCHKFERKQRCAIPTGIMLLTSLSFCSLGLQIFIEDLTTRRVAKTGMHEPHGINVVSWR